MVLALAAEQARRGDEVVIVTLAEERQREAPPPAPPGCRIVRYRRSHPGAAVGFSWGMLFGMSKALREADVVHVHSNWTFPVWWGAWCALRAGKVLVMSPHGCFDPVRLRHSRWKKRLVGGIDRALLRRADVVHATSEMEREWIDCDHQVVANTRIKGGTDDARCRRHRGGWEAEDSLSAGKRGSGGERPENWPQAMEQPKPQRMKQHEILTSNLRPLGGRKSRAKGRPGAKAPRPRIVVVPNGVHLPPMAQERARDPARTRMVLYLGRLHPLKGLDLLVEAWALCPQSGRTPKDEGGRMKAEADAPSVPPLSQALSRALSKEAQQEAPGGENAEGRSAAQPRAAAEACRPPEVAGERQAGEGERESGRVPAAAQGEPEEQHKMPHKILSSNLRPLGGRNEDAACDKAYDKGRAEHANTPTHPHTHTPTSRRWRLVIAGPDEQATLASLQRRARELGLLESITFAGPVYGAAKERLMEEADVVVLPSRSENYGLVVAEALAAGVPVIATKATPWAELQGNSASSKVREFGSSIVPGSEIKELVDESDRARKQQNFRTLELQNSRTSRCGWWVEVGVEPLADALGEAMSLTDEQRSLMGENGRRLVEAKYDWKTIAKQMEKVYSSCIRRDLDKGEFCG